MKKENFSSKGKSKKNKFMPASCIAIFQYQP